MRRNKRKVIIVRGIFYVIVSSKLFSPCFIRIGNRNEVKAFFQIPLYFEN